MATKDQLYAKFGITAEAAQLFETELSTLLLAVRGVEKGWHIEPDPDNALKVSNEIDSHTLGTLLKRLSRVVKFDDNLTDRFASALQARNQLTHGFFERHNFKIQTDEGRDVMIADLEKLHDELFQAWQIAAALTQVTNKALVDHIQKMGTPERKEELKRAMEKRDRLLKRYLPQEPSGEN